MVQKCGHRLHKLEHICVRVCCSCHATSELSTMSPRLIYSSVVLYSTSYTTAIEPLEVYFNVMSDPVVTLGLTSYLLGLAVGSLLLAPVSEIYGRRVSISIRSAIPHRNSTL